jgi:DNA-binding beta-propeller fold protein YncE
MRLKRNALATAFLLAGLAGPAGADELRFFDDFNKRPGSAFERIATFPVYINNENMEDTTVAEIVAVSADGRTLAYTDASLGVVGFVDITQPSMPVAAGTLDVGGSPTSVAILGNELVLVAVDTSESFTAPSGELRVFDLRSRAARATLPLGGQPDSIALSADGKYAAVVLENQRDEEVEVDGEEGGLPQLPSGELAIVDLTGAPSAWTLRRADLTGLSAYAPTDAEPEFVDINERNEAVVSLQENNHVAIVDLKTGKVVDDFPAGTVDLDAVDATEDALISLTESLTEVPREPDAVAWIPGGDRGRRFPPARVGDRALTLIATANEGDLFGGSRGFSIFDRDGNVVFDSGSAFDALAVRHGHYNEDRSENKGSEPEAIEFGRFGGEDYLFVGSERGSFVAVYELGHSGGAPRFKQLLPAPLGPEGLLAVPQRGLLVASGEEDDPAYGVRSTIMIYKLEGGEPSYPQIVSANDAAGSPIGWSALSGLVAVPGRDDRLLAVWDSYYSEGRIFTVDASKKPAVIVQEQPIRGGSGNYDNEGIAIAPDGTYWIASEGNAGARRNRLLQTDTLGNVIAEIALPAEIEACRAATTNRGTLGSGFEGVTVVPQGRDYLLAIAQQRGWDYTTAECEALDDDPTGANAGEPKFSRIWLFDPRTGEWDHVAYELEPRPANAAWVGLSEITRVGSSFVVLERDNLTGDFGELKTLVRFSAGALADGVISRQEKTSFDLIPALERNDGWITDKPEGVAVTNRGQVFVVTDNDGVDGWSGETWFLRLGPISKLFR